MTGMENGEVTLYGMSSVNEYWSRASETDRSEIKSSSSDDSADESESSGKEYRDASCYVDFDEELEEIGDEDASNIVEDSWEIINFSKSKIEDKEKLRASRYVRWEVLMSLGLGLWAVLCIVDVLHSEKPVTGGWFFEATREKKKAPRTESAKAPEAHFWWFLYTWPYLWRIIWISSSGGAYILLILLLVAFCADPRLRKTAGQVIIKNNLNTRIPPEKEVKNSIVENKTLSIPKKLQNSRVVRPVSQKVDPVKLVLYPAIHLHAKILSNVEQRFTQTSVVKRSLATVSTISQPSIGKLRECRKTLIVNRSFLGQLRIANCKTLKFFNINRRDAHFSAKASVYLADASTSCYSVRKIDFELEEHPRRTKKCPHLFNSFKMRSIEPGRNPTELSTNGDTRTRIITSSPAFKNFLLRLRHNSCVS